MRQVTVRLIYTAPPDAYPPKLHHQGWHWTAYGRNGRKIATSGEKYRDKAGALKAIRLLFGPDTTVTLRHVDGTGETLRAADDTPRGRAVTGPAKYRKRPVVIEAMQWDGDEFGERLDDLIEWTDQLHTTESGRTLVRTLFMALQSDAALDVFDYDDIRQRIKDGYTAVVWDKLHDCWVNVATGDWIIKGIQGEFYPCRAEVFAETYEADQ